MKLVNNILLGLGLSPSVVDTVSDEQKLNFYNALAPNSFIIRSTDRTAATFVFSSDSIVTDKKPDRPKVFNGAYACDVMSRAGTDGYINAPSSEFPNGSPFIGFDVQGSLAVTAFLFNIVNIKILESLPPLVIRCSRASASVLANDALSVFLSASFKSDDEISVTAQGDGTRVSFTYTPTFEYRNMGMNAVSKDATLLEIVAESTLVNTASVENYVLPDLYFPKKKNPAPVKFVFNVNVISGSFGMQLAAENMVDFVIAGADTTIAATNLTILLNVKLAGRGIATSAVNVVTVTMFSALDMVLVDGLKNGGDFTVTVASGDALSIALTLPLIGYGTSEILPIGPRVFKITGGAAVRVTLVPLNFASTLGQQVFVSQNLAQKDNN